MPETDIRPPQAEILFHNMLVYADGRVTHQGTGFFAEGSDGRIVGITAAHFLRYDEALFLVASLQAPKGRAISVFTTSWGPRVPGPVDPSVDSTLDYLLMPADDPVPPEIVLQLDQRTDPVVGEHVWFPDTNSEQPSGYDVIEGTVIAILGHRIEVELSRTIEPAAQSGTPFISRQTGRVIGTLSWAQETDGPTKVLYACKASNINAALNAGVAPVRLTDAIQRDD